MFPETLIARLNGIVSLDAGQVAALAAHYDLLIRWNRILNLTTVTQLEQAVERHYCESLFLGARLPERPMSIVDIGSGPGFPGFPVAILRPDCPVTLVESHQRKAVFLKEAARGHANIRILAKRADAVREGFDFAISRAVSYADLSGVLKSCASNIGLLTGSDEPPANMGFEWLTPERLPWGENRFLRIGKRIS